MPGDPLAYAPLIRQEKKSALLLQARSDELIPNVSGELFAASLGATFVGLAERSAPPRFASLPAASAPWRGDVALVQLSPATHTMFTSMAGDRRYDPDAPEPEALATPETIDNPIELVHRLTTRFADGWRRGQPSVEP